MSTFQLEAMLSRRVLWTGKSGVHEEYVVGEFRTLRIRVSNDKFTDVMGDSLTVAQIQFLTS
jgi:hypothetical protein